MSRSFIVIEWFIYNEGENQMSIFIPSMKWNKKKTAVKTKSEIFFLDAA